MIGSHFVDTGSLVGTHHAGQIMIVEEETDTALYLRDTLERLGYRITASFTNGMEAIEGARKLHPDLILMDLHLYGEQDGIGVANTIHEDLDVPVVFLASSEEEFLLQQARLEEPFSFMVKPVSEYGLQTTIETALHHHDLASGLRQQQATIGAIANAVQEALVMANKDGDVTFWNPAAEQMFGYAQSEIMGKPICKILLSRDCREIIEKRIKTFPGRGNALMHERFVKLNALRKDGSQFPAEISFSEFQFNGEWYLLGVVRNISEQKRIEEERKQHTQRIEKNLVQTIQAISMALEKHDPNTANHQQIVANLAVAIAMEMGLPKDQMEGVYLGGVVHDIGKIGVPTEILIRPGRLSPVEYEIIKTHPQIGYEIVKGVDFNWPVSEMVLQHHERYDGHGYPHGLGGEDILPESRIIGVADVVTAMALHRPYRPGLGVDRALKEVNDHKGVLFDPKVVDACTQVFKDNRFSFQESYGQSFLP